MKGIIGKCSRNSLFIEIGNCLDIYLIRLKEESENAGLKLNIQKMKIMASSPITSGKEMGKQWKQWQTLFSWTPKSLQMVTAAMKLKNTCSLEGKLRQTYVV